MAFFTNTRLEERQEAFDEVNSIKKNRTDILIIHYSCESFFNSNGRTPRITSICIKNRAENTIQTFSIHLEAQFAEQELCCINDKYFDILEKKMLLSFYKYLIGHSQYIWIHWNMSNCSYGFQAIENRFKILKGKPSYIKPKHKKDLKHIIEKLFTTDFESDKPNGKILNLAIRNNISIKNALKGEDEAKAFKNKEYLDLQMSNTRKVEVLDRILDLIEQDNLKVKTSLLNIYGCDIKGIYAICKNNLLLTIIASVILYSIGAALEPVIQNLAGTN